MRSLALAAAIGLLLVPQFARAADTPQPIQLQLDASDAPRNLFHGTMHIPVHAGPVTLVYPKWIPGEHGPTGPITDFVGTVFTVGGKEIAWRRDPVDMYAYHVDVPEGATMLDVAFDFLGATSSSGFTSAASATPNLAIIAWNQVLLYPDGTKSDDVQFQASITTPAGWQSATALTVAGRQGDRIDYKPVSLTTLVDSPVLMGRYFRVVPLDKSARPVELDIAADSPAALDISPESVTAMQNLVKEADALFGARHYDHYNFLFTLSDHVAHFGLEHHQSNDTRQPERTLLDKQLRLGLWVLSHEYVHSWNAKHRRPAGLATPNYQEPMKGQMLWVYEGLTEYLGALLAARSGIWSPDDYRERLADMAAFYDHVRGRDWRPLRDTCDAAQLLYEAPHEWEMSRRGTDFYDEGWMMWLDVDTRIRSLTKGARSLDDFCHAFYGGESGPPTLVTYTYDDIVNALGKIVAYDWRGYFETHVMQTTEHPPLDGLTRGGWSLVYNDTKNTYLESVEKSDKKLIETAFSIGLRVKTDGTIEDVAPGSTAFMSDIGPGMNLVAVNGRKFSSDVLKDAIKAAPSTKGPLELLIENHEFFSTHPLDYHDGLRNPHLAREAKAADVLSEIIAPHAAAPKKK
jgi:predicted metalloprotease with PDZ domain